MFQISIILIFEVSHYIKEKPIYEQGFILISHLTTLAYKSGPGGEVISTYPIFVINVFHIINSGILKLGGIYHSIFGPDKLEETKLGLSFSFSWYNNIAHLVNFTGQQDLKHLKHRDSYLRLR